MGTTSMDLRVLGRAGEGWLQVCVSVATLSRFWTGHDNALMEDEAQAFAEWLQYLADDVDYVCVRWPSFGTLDGRVAFILISVGEDWVGLEVLLAGRLAAPGEPLTTLTLRASAEQLREWAGQLRSDLDGLPPESEDSWGTR